MWNGKETSMTNYSFAPLRGTWRATPAKNTSASQLLLPIPPVRMRIFPANVNWNSPVGSSIPEIPHCAISVLEKSGIGEAFLNLERHERGVYIIGQEELPSLEDVLEGEPWFGSKEMLPMVQFFKDYVTAHPEQRTFCFIVNDG